MTYIPSYAPAHRLSHGRRRDTPKFWLWQFLDLLQAFIVDTWRAIVKFDTRAWIVIIYVLAAWLILMLIVLGPQIMEKIQ